MIRLPELTLETMNEDQRRVADAITAGPRGSIRGPFPTLLRSPGLARCAQELGAYIRYESGLAPNLRELAILITARFWRAQYEWYAHSKIAREIGISESVLGPLQENRRPDFEDPAEETVYNFCTAMLNDHAADDAASNAILELLGEEQLVDLIGLLGYYSLLAMLMDTFEIPVPDGDPPFKN